MRSSSKKKSAANDTPPSSKRSAPQGAAKGISDKKNATLKKSGVPASPLKIMLVDDDPMICSSISRALKLSGYEVAVASTGHDAVARYNDFQPDISLVDIHLPDIDGFAVMKAVRALNPSSEIIFITGEGDMNLVIEALRCGVSDFVPKPLSLKVLESVIANARGRLSQAPSSLTKSTSTALPSGSSNAPRVLVQTFGGLSVTVEGVMLHEKDWHNFKTAAVFKLLLINHRKVVTLDELIESIWHDVVQRSAEVMVFTAIAFIRRLFEPNLKHGRASRYVLNHEAGYELNLGQSSQEYRYDAEDFERLIQKAKTTRNVRDFEEAIALYHDDFLKNNLNDEWAAYKRQTLKDMYLFALLELTRTAFNEKNFTDAALYAQKMISADSLYEEAYAFSIRSYLAQNRLTDAKRIAEHCNTAFQKILGEPAPKTILDLAR
jgi:two-component SAPR family response regulator